MKPADKSSTIPKWAFVLLGILLILLIGTLLGVPTQAAQTYGPADPGLNPFLKARYAITLLRGKDQLLVSTQTTQIPHKFTIAPDESVSSVCRRLQEGSFTTSGALLCTYLVYSGLDRQIQTGTYTLKPELNSLEIANVITDPAARDIAFIIYSGWRLEENCGKH